MKHNSINPNISNNLVANVQEQSLLIYLGKKTALFSTLLKKLTLGWGKIFTRSELIKILNSLSKQGLVQLEARNLDLIVKPITSNTPQRK